MKVPQSEASEPPLGESQSPQAAIDDARRRYFAVAGMYSLSGGFVASSFPLFLSNRGLDQFHINSLPAIFLFVWFVTSVPAGALADTIGRRRSFLIGAPLRVLGFLLYFLSHSYSVFVIAELIDGTGSALCGSSIDAWGVDALDAAGFEGIKDRLFSRLTQLMSLCLLATALLGAYVAELDLSWPWLLSSVGFGATAIAGAFLMRGKGGARPTITKATPSLRHARLYRGSRHEVALQSVLMISLAAGITAAGWNHVLTEWPVFLRDRLSIRVWMMGWIFGGITLAQVMGAEITARLAPDSKRRPVRACTMIVLGSALLLAAGILVGRPFMTIAALLTAQAFVGALVPLLLGWINDCIPAARRATLLGFSGLFQRGGAAVGLLVGGYVADHGGIALGWQLSAIVSLFAVPLLIAAARQSPPIKTTGLGALLPPSGTPATRP